uniref:CHCH domain-containing protein n=1 Tax=Rhizophora mucronata TaxID=61149 RepID=A0A2P2JJ85_RHIMU
MEKEKAKGPSDDGAKKIASPCDVEALKKCLEENKGDYVKCQSQIEAFKSSCSIQKTTSSVESATKL